MSEIPDDIWRTAGQFMDQYNQGGFAPDTIIARAILAERKRCADAVLAEKLVQPENDPGDVAYDTAIDHAHDAIWRI